MSGRTGWTRVRIAGWSLLLLWSGCEESPSRQGGTNQLQFPGATVDFAAELGEMKRLDGIEGSPVGAVVGDRSLASQTECSAKEGDSAPKFLWSTQTGGESPYYSTDVGLVRFPAGESCDATLEGVFPDKNLVVSDLSNYRFEPLVQRAQAIQDVAGTPLYVAAYDVGSDQCTSVDDHQGGKGPVDSHRWSAVVVETLKHINNQRHDPVCADSASGCCPYDDFCDLPNAACPAGGAARDIDKVEVCHPHQTTTISQTGIPCTGKSDCGDAECCDSGMAAAFSCTQGFCFWIDGRCYPPATEIVPVPRNCADDSDCGDWGRCCTAARKTSGECGAAQQGPNGEAMCFCNTNGDCGASRHACCTPLALQAGYCQHELQCYCDDDGACPNGGCCDQDGIDADLCTQNQLGACYRQPASPTCPDDALCVGQARDDEETYCATDFVFDRCPANQTLHVCQVEVLDEPFERGGYGRDQVTTLFSLYQTFAGTLKSAYPDGKWVGTCSCGMDIIGPALLLDPATDTLRDEDLEDLPAVVSAREFVAHIAETEAAGQHNRIFATQTKTHCLPSCDYNDITESDLKRLQAHYVPPAERFIPDSQVTDCKVNGECRDSSNPVTKLIKCCTAGQVANGWCAADERGRCVLRCADDSECQVADDPLTSTFHCCTAAYAASGVCAASLVGQCLQYCTGNADCQNPDDPLTDVFVCCTAAEVAAGGCTSQQRGQCLSACRADADCQDESVGPSAMMQCCNAERQSSGQCPAEQAGRCFLPDSCRFLDAFSFHAKVRFPYQALQLTTKLRQLLDDEGLPELPLWLTNLRFELPDSALSASMRASFDSKPELYSAWYGASLVATRILLQDLVDQLVVDRGARAYQDPSQPDAAATIDSYIFDTLPDSPPEHTQWPAAYAWMPFRLIPASAKRMSIQLDDATDRKGFAVLAAKLLDATGNWKIYAIVANANIHLGQSFATYKLTFANLPPSVRFFNWRAAQIRSDTDQFVYSESGQVTISEGQFTLMQQMSVPGVTYVELTQL